MEIKFRKLRATEIECRVGTINSKGFSILLYKDARVDMTLLDETVGATNWQRDHKDVKGNLYCGISIWDADKNQWITKWDCGIESFGNDGNEKKGESSDSFKRAGFNWGIGRELYTAPFIWIEGNTKEVDKNGRKVYVPTIKTMKVNFIDYNKNGEIAHLKIYGDNKMIFGYNEQPSAEEGTEAKTERKKTPKTFTPKDLQQDPTEQKPTLRVITLDEAEDCLTPKGAKLGDLTLEQLQKIIANERYDEYIRKCASIIAKDLDDFVRDDEGNVIF